MTQTSIQLDSDIRDRLRAQKRGGETYNDVLERLLERADG